MKKILFLLPFVFLFACKNEPKVSAEVPTTYEDVDPIITPNVTEKVATEAQPISPTHEAITDESISLPNEDEACEDAILALVKSSVRVQETMKSIEKEGYKTAFIILKDDKQKGVYHIKLGVNLELRFDTWTNFTYFTKEENLTEQDVVSGGNEPIDFDLKLAEKLPKSCTS